MAENITNDFSTTLSGAINSAVVSLSVASSAGAPSANFRIRIDDELMLVTNVSGTTWTVTRGAEGTAAAAHSSGAVVVHVVTAGGLDARYARPDAKQTFSAQQTPMNGTLTDGATVNWDGDSNGQVVYLTTAAARTIAAPTNIVAGTMYKLVLTSGGFTPAFNSAYKFVTTPASLTGTCIFNFLGAAGNTLLCEGYTVGLP